MRSFRYGPNPPRRAEGKPCALGRIFRRTQDDVETLVHEDDTDAREQSTQIIAEWYVKMNTVDMVVVEIAKHPVFTEMSDGISHQVQPGRDSRLKQEGLSPNGRRQLRIVASSKTQRRIRRMEQSLAA